MKWVVLLSAIAAITTIYETPSNGVEVMAEGVADDSASSVKYELDSKISELQQRIDDQDQQIRELEQRAVTRW